jgi:hypothetical protein
MTWDSMYRLTVRLLLARHMSGVRSVSLYPHTWSGNPSHSLAQMFSS